MVTGSTTTVSVSLTGSGAGTVSYWGVDNAGNAETPNTVALKWDNIAPTVTHTLSPTQLERLEQRRRHRVLRRQG